ncbi:TIGR00725 family protein [Oceanotoga sp. DSM 15011]|jgi:hypothetical protein|uniref:TIGR00725 family protein n=1 Tax=Oceanotoga teriensis TaxID=515440 RepID=A0AA45C674_9BACT|nr:MULTISPECIES: TIGR00725 family protein [Oceanotoga]MDN5343108.1 hypothetical protein [Oceanotoga sp.]MDO7977561.1 TIGR00725 family protein [Oceanotoga teriensis]PWJ91219.1 hypothetical protein C7380_11121 [Oceanotoga teriensis]UYO99694.1 TIGR00725 family protein [Oceanotoga sp. DSM 15011]
MNIGVIGYSGDKNLEPVKSLKNICFEIGKLIAENGDTLLTGGRDGIMDFVCESAYKNNANVVGILPWDEEGNKYLNTTIKTGLDFSMRSFVLLKSVDIVISVGGQVGTALEILGAYAYKKPIILMRGTGGWTDTVTKTLIEDKYLDNRKMVELYQAYNIEELSQHINNLRGDVNL